MDPVQDFQRLRKLLGEVPLTEITDEFLKDRINFISGRFDHPELRTTRFINSVMWYFRKHWKTENPPDLDKIDLLIMDCITTDTNEFEEEYHYTAEEHAL